MNGNDTMYGNGGNDWLEASGGDSTIDGGPGNDKIVSGVGNDVLTGGADADTFVFRDNAPGHDRITEFNAAEGDRIDFSQNAFVKQMSDIGISDDGNGNAVLSYGTNSGPSSVVLTGIAPAAVSAGWFIFDTRPKQCPDALGRSANGDVHRRQAGDAVAEHHGSGPGQPLSRERNGHRLRW